MVYIYTNTVYFNIKVIWVLQCRVFVSFVGLSAESAFPCSLIAALLAHFWTPENGCSIFLRHVSKVLLARTGAHPKKIRQECMKRGIRLPSETKFYVNVAPRSKESLCLVPGGFHHAASPRLLTLH
jgi:hypothetical protein